MIKPFYEEEFDVREYINKRILEINSLSDRMLYREMTEAFMIELFEKHRQDCMNLVQKVLDEVSQSDTHCDISIGLIEKEKYDGTDTFLYPMIEIENQSITIENIKKSLENNEVYFLQNIYLKDIYRIVKKFKDSKNTFLGSIRTTEKSYNVRFLLTFDERYLNKIKQLYETFNINSMSWNTVCIAHIIRVFSLSIESFVDENIENIKGEFLDFNVDFGEYNTKFIQDVIPLWNISVFEEKTSAFPTPVNEGLKYEHTILCSRFKKDSNFLVCSNDIDIYYILKNKENLTITCNDNSPRKWTLFEIHNNTKNKEYTYPVLNNISSSSLTGDLREKYRKRIYTKAEIERIIQETPYSNKIDHCTIEVKKIHTDTCESYLMDDFIFDEIKNNDVKNPVLLLTFFVNNMEDYLIYDYISFIVTKVQEHVPQYHCIGTLGGVMS